MPPARRRTAIRRKAGSRDAVSPSALHDLYALGLPSYDSVGHVQDGELHPDGNQANYTYTTGVVSGLTLTMGGTTVNGATAISYQPVNLGMASDLQQWPGQHDGLRYGWASGPASGVPIVQSLGFTYDNADRITQVANGIDGTQTQYFGYDAMSRLIFGVLRGGQREFPVRRQRQSVSCRRAQPIRSVPTSASDFKLRWKLNTATIHGATIRRSMASLLMDTMRSTG